MKKVCFYILIILLTGFQAVNSQNFRFGIKGGLNSVGIFGPDVPNTFERQFGYNAGIYIDSRVGEFLSSVVEVNYARYRFAYTNLYIDSLNNRFLSVQEKNDLLNVPVMLRYKRGYEFIFFYLNAGMQFSLLLKNNRNTTLFINNLPVDDDYYFPYKHSWYDYGLIGGAGMQFKALNIDLKYYFSTKNVYKEVGALEMRYNVLNLELGWQFNYRDRYAFGRKTGWKGLKYKIKHLF